MAESDANRHSRARFVLDHETATQEQQQQLLQLILNPEGDTHGNE
jgi:hypothetical protein